MSNPQSPDQPEAQTAAAETPAGRTAGDAGTVQVKDISAEAADSEGVRLAAAEAEIAKLKDAYLRALAETENVRRRAARDAGDAGKYAITAFARDLLAVADNLRRALEAVDPATRSADPALDALVCGVEITERSLLGVFERYGITPIEAAGLPFDPNVHEAMFEQPDESVASGTVVSVVEQGYRIHDRPLRPARVGVSRGGPKAVAPATEAPAQSGFEPFSKSRTAPYEQSEELASDQAGGAVDEKL